jgi:hypothetical protein
MSNLRALRDTGARPQSSVEEREGNGGYNGRLLNCCLKRQPGVYCEAARPFLRPTDRSSPLIKRAIFS